MGMAYESLKKNTSWSPAHQPAKENTFAPRPYTPQPEQEKEVTAQPEAYSREGYDLIASRMFPAPNATVQKQAAPQPQTSELESEQEEQEKESTNAEKLSTQGNPEQPSNNTSNSSDEQTPIQTKLTIGTPGDQYEQEADNVARQVMSMDVPQPQVQRQNAQSETEVNTKPLSLVQRHFIARTQAAQRSRTKPIPPAEYSPFVQRHIFARTQVRNTIQKSGNSTNQATPNLEHQLNSKKGSGNPLDNQTRSFMESRFGTDFSSVRVHTDSTAIQMNKDLGAQAFTHGSDIFYGGGKSPGQNELTAHELTHVVQQGGAKKLNQQVQTKPEPKTADVNKEVRLFPEPQTLAAKQLPETVESLNNKESTSLHQKIENYNPETPVQTKQLNTENLIQRQPLNISSVSPRIQGVFSWMIEKALGSQVVSILGKAGNVLGKIIQNPVGFLGNLVKSIRNGFTKFRNNIGTHLTNGLMGWLFGALSGSGLILPSNFDAKGLLSITLQALGITYHNFRGRLTKRLGNEKVNRLEQSYDFLQKIASGGLTEAWQDICQEVGDIKNMILGGIKDWVINTIITKAITKLITMFNPVGGLIEAAKAIYNTVMFFIERAQQIAALVSSIFNSIGKIVAGDTNSASNYIEQAMGRTIPVIISFLARLIGLGGVSDRIKGVIKRIQAPINKALDKLEEKIVNKAKTLSSGNQRQNQAPQKGVITPVNAPAKTPTRGQTPASPKNTSPAKPPTRNQTPASPKNTSPAKPPTRNQTPASPKNTSPVKPPTRNQTPASPKNAANSATSPKQPKTSPKQPKASPEARKQGAVKKFTSLMAAKGSMSIEEMQGVFVNLKAEFQLSKIQLEGVPNDPKIGFYASPATFLPIRPKVDKGIVPGQKPKVAKAKSVSNGDYIKPVAYDGPFPTPGKEVADALDARFKGQKTIHNNGTTPVAKAKTSAGTISLYSVQPINPKALSLRTKTNGGVYRRAGTVEAQSSVTRGTGRSGSGETLFGHFGADEERIRTGRNTTNYNGGHLIGDQIMDSRRAFNLYEDWNLAPQVRAFNSPVYTSTIENPVTAAINAGATVKYTVGVKYPDNTYNIAPSDLIKNLLPAPHGYRKEVEGAIKRNPGLNAPLNLRRRTPGFWQATAEVIAGGATIDSGNINARQNVAFENNPVNVGSRRNYNPTGREQVRYTLRIDTGAGLTTSTAPTPKSPLAYTGATTVRATARQQTF
jgi:hypothetical protein